MNPQRDRGIRAEIEACKLLTKHLGINVRRMATEGRFDDIGDLAGIPDCTVQVSAVPDNPTIIAARALKKSADVERQRQRAGTAHAVVLLRIDGGHWRALCTTRQLDTVSQRALATSAVFIDPPRPGQIIRWAPHFSWRDWSLVTGTPLFVATLDGWARTFTNRGDTAPDSTGR